MPPPCKVKSFVSAIHSEDLTKLFWYLSQHNLPQRDEDQSCPRDAHGHVQYFGHDAAFLIVHVLNHTDVVVIERPGILEADVVGQQVFFMRAQGVDTGMQ